MDTPPLTMEHLRLFLQQPIAFHRLFADIAGGALPGLFLSQAWYWSQRTEDREGWFYHSEHQWYHETGMTRREQETARRYLKERGLLEEERREVTYFRLVPDALVAACLACHGDFPADDCTKTPKRIGGKRQSGLAENANHDCTKTPKRIGGKRHSLKETIPETIQETIPERGERAREGNGMAASLPTGNVGGVQPPPADFAPTSALLTEATRIAPDVDLERATRRFMLTPFKAVLDWGERWLRFIIEEQEKHGQRSPPVATPTFTNPVFAKAFDAQKGGAP